MWTIVLLLGFAVHGLAADDDYVHVVWVDGVPDPGESFSVQYAGFPGNSSDWFTVVPVDYADDKYGEWFYTSGAVDGAILVQGLDAGHYEVRSYFNWPAGGFEVQARFPFSVGSPDYPQGRYAWTTKQVYEPGEAFVVEYHGLPGNTRDWITVVPWEMGDSGYQQYAYLQGSQAGTLDFRGLDAGRYEVRVFFNWPSGGYEVRDRHTFWVGMEPPSALESDPLAAPVGIDAFAWTGRTTYRSRDEITVHFAGLPGNRTDWITVVPVEAADERYGQFHYTDGAERGELRFQPLSPGDYEVRVFFHWPSGSYNVQSRYRFTVTD